MGEISDALARARENSGRSPAPREPVPARPKPSPRSSDYPPARVSRESADAEKAARIEAERAARASTTRDPEPEPPRELAPEPVPEPSRDAAPEAKPEEAAPTHPETHPETHPGPPVHSLPRNLNEGWISRLCIVDPDGNAATRFRHLAVRLRAMIEDRRHSSILVTSALPGEGKTTVSINLAIALASVAPDSRIALVDMDLRRGCVAEVLEYDADVGIEHVLAGDLDLEQVRVQTDMPALDFYSLGNRIPDAHRLLGGSAERVLQQLHARYDIVVCDGPPVLPVPDIPLLAPHIGGCLLVAAAGRTRHAAFRETMDLLPRSFVLGVFLNEHAAAETDGHYRYYGADSGKKPAGVSGEVER